MRGLYLGGVFSSLLVIFLLNQLIFGPQGSLFEDNAHRDFEKVKNSSWLEDSRARIVTVDDLPTIKPLDCVRTKPVLEVSPLICIKSVQEDRFISLSLLYNGIWEEDIVTNVLKAVKLYKVIKIKIFRCMIGFFRMLCFWTLDQILEFTLCLWLNFDALPVMVDLAEWLLWMHRQTTWLSSATAWSRTTSPSK